MGHGNTFSEKSSDLVNILIELFMLPEEAVFIVCGFLDIPITRENMVNTSWQEKTIVAQFQQFPEDLCIFLS